MKNRLLESHKHGALAPFFNFDFLRYLKQLLKLLLNIKYCAVVAYPRAALKMEDKAAVVHIYSAHRCHLVV